MISRRKAPAALITAAIGAFGLACYQGSASTPMDSGGPYGLRVVDGYELVVGENRYIATTIRFGWTNWLDYIFHNEARSSSASILIRMPSRLSRGSCDIPRECRAYFVALGEHHATSADWPGGARIVVSQGQGQPRTLDLQFLDSLGARTGGFLIEDTGFVVDAEELSRRIGKAAALAPELEQWRSDVESAHKSGTAR